MRKLRKVWISLSIASLLASTNVFAQSIEYNLCKVSFNQMVESFELLKKVVNMPNPNPYIVKGYMELLNYNNNQILETCSPSSSEYQKAIKIKQMFLNLSEESYQGK